MTSALDERMQNLQIGPGSGSHGTIGGNNVIYSGDPNRFFQASTQ